MSSSAAGDAACDDASLQGWPATASHLAAMADLVADRSRPLADAGAEFLRRVAEITGMDGALLCRVDPNGGGTVLAAAGAGGITPGERVPPYGTLAGGAVGETFPLAVPDTAAEPDWRVRAACLPYPAVRACYGAPVLRPDGRRFGVLAGVAATPRALDQERRDLLAVMAAVAAPLALRLDAASNDAAPSAPAPNRGHDQSRFRAMVEHASEAFAETDRTGRIRYANPAFTDLVGRRPGDGGDLLGLVHPSDAGAWAAALAGDHGAPTATLTGRLRGTSGAWSRVEATAVRRGSDAGNEAIVLAIRNVTERSAIEAGRARAEREVRHERDLLRTVMDAIPDVLIVKDAEGRYLRVNRAAADLLGIADPEEAVGRSPDAFWSREAAAGVARDDARVLAGGPMADVLMQSERGDGRWFLTNRLPLRDTDGRVTGLVVAARDVTELHRAGQDALSREGLLARYKLLVDSTSDIIAELDAEIIVRTINPAVTRLMGHQQETIVGTSGFDWIVPEDLPAVREQFARIVATPGISPSIVTRAVRADGSPAWLEFTPNNRLHDPAVGTIVCVIRDVSLRREAEARLRAERDLLQAVIDASSEIIAVRDRSGRFALMNAAAAQAFGLPDVAAGIGKRPSDLFSPAEAARQEHEARRTMETGALTTNEVVYADGLGAPAWYLVNRHPLRDTDGTVTGMVGVARDVSALKLAEQAAAAERDLLQAFIDVVPDMLFLKDLDGRYLRMNASYAAWLGLPNPAAGVGKTVGDFTAPADAAALAEQVRRIAETGEPLRDYLFRIGRGGEERWFLRTKRPHRDAGGRVVGIVGVYRDVTEVKHAELAVERERNFLQMVLDALPGHVYVLDADQRFLLVNRAAAAAVGLADPVHARGRRPEDFWPTDVAGWMASDNRRVLAGEAIWDRVMDMVTTDAGAITVLTTQLPLRDESGQIVGIIGTSIDVTALRRIEESLEQERDLLQQILDALNDRIVVKDRHGGFVRINRAAARHLGLADRNAAVGRHAQAFERPGDAVGDPAGDAAALAGDEVEAVVEEPGADGQPRWTLVGKTPLRGPDGDIVGLVAAATDITVVKEAERRLAEALRREQAINAELERLDRARGAFIAMLSHEFRTPLTAIMGYGEMLREFEPDPATTREYAGEIARSADRLSRLTGDLLELERMRTDRFRIEQAPVDLADLLREVVTALRPSSPNHDLRLEVDANLPPVSGDADRLVQVFTNLVSNAVKYSPDGGAVVVAARAEAGHVVASVRDEGLGIPPEDLERVFEAYIRLDTGGKRGIRGTGLGLPIARQLVELHGGAIWADSTPGVGSTFVVRLPVDEATGDRRQATDVRL